MKFGLEHFDPKFAGMCFDEPPPVDPATSGDGLSEVAKTAIKKANDDAASSRIEATNAKKKVEEYEAKESERQRKADEESGNWKKIAEDAQRDTAKAMAKLENDIGIRDQRIISTELNAKAKAAGVLDTAIGQLSKFIDPSKFGVEPLSGTVTGIDDQLAALKIEMPFLFGVAPAAPTGDGRPGGAAPAAGGGTGGGGGSAKPNMRDRTAVDDTTFKNSWATLGKS